MYIYLRKILWWALCCLGCLSSQAQNSEFKFNHLGNKDGITGGVCSMLKDSRGNLWIGNFGGLMRFDGTHFYSFRKGTPPHSLPNSIVFDLCEDKKGNIWGTTQSGIFRYTPSLNQFKNYSTIQIKEGPGVENILCDASGNIWAGGIPGLLKYHAEADSFVQILADSADPNTPTINRIRQNCMLLDASGNGIWVATRDGLYYIDTKTNACISYKNRPNSKLFNRHSVRALAHSPKGHIWMFDNDLQSIIGFKPGSDSAIYSFNLSAHIKESFGATLFEDSHSRLWFSSYEGQVVVVDYQGSKSITHVDHQDDDPSSIGSNFFWDAMEDADGTIWLGTITGISTCNTDREFYTLHSISKTVPLLQENFAISSLAENKKDSTWWIATLQGKAVHYFPKSRKSEVIDLGNAMPNDLGERPGRFLQISFIDNLVVFNTDKGSWQWAPGYNRPKPFTLLPDAFRQYKVVEMTTANQKEFWFTDYNSLLYWNTQTQTTKLYQPTADMKNTTVAVPAISMLHLSPSGHILWMQKGSVGFAWVEPGGKEIKPEPFNLPVEKTRIAYFSTFRVDHSGNVWFGYIGHGLYMFDKGQSKFRWWDASDYLKSSDISSAELDDLGRVWGMSYNNVSLFEPGNNVFYEFSLPFGNAQFAYSNITTKLSNGHILANVKGDLVEFFPEKVTAKPVDAKPIISAVDIAGKQKLLFQDSMLVLPPNDNFVTFRFGTLTSKNYFPHVIEYMLEGMDNNWREAGSTNEASYTQLPPGTYTFKVRVLGKSNEWKSAEKKMVVIVKAPFYKTVWFRLLIVLLLAGLLYFWYRERMDHQAKLFTAENKAQLLAKEKTQVQYENLKQHLNPHFLFNSLSSLSSLIEIDPKMAGRFLGSLSKIYRYILQSKDKDTVPLKDEIAFVQSFIALQQTRFEQGLQVHIHIDESDYHRHIVPVTLQNLIENAIKHNIIDEENILQIDISTADDYLVVKNKMQLKKFVETSNNQGLENLKHLYSYLSEKPLQYNREDEYFVVKIPLL